MRWEPPCSPRMTPSAAASSVVTAFLWDDVSDPVDEVDFTRLNAFKSAERQSGLSAAALGEHKALAASMTDGNDGFFADTGSARWKACFRRRGRRMWQASRPCRANKAEHMFVVS